MLLFFFNLGGSLVCSGYETCNDAFITLFEYSNLFNDTINSANVVPTGVYCTARENCVDSNIKAYEDSIIYCGGYKSCAEANMLYSNSLYCSGRDSCQYSTVYNISNVYVTGYGAMRGGIISIDNGALLTPSSNSWNSSSNVYFFSNSSRWFSGVTIVCHAGSKCDIYCMTHGACTDVTIIECDYNVRISIQCNQTYGIECASIVEYNELDSGDLYVCHHISTQTYTLFEGTTTEPPNSETGSNRVQWFGITFENEGIGM